MSQIQDEILSLMKTTGSSNIRDFELSIQEHADDIKSKVKDSITVKDAYGNSLLDIGNKDEREKFNNYTFTNDTLNWPIWLALYNDSWVFKRAIDKPSQDMIRTGISLEGSADNNDKIYNMLNKHRFDFIQLLTWGHLFGGSVAIMMFDNLSEDDYLKPMNFDKLKKHKVIRFYVVDRWYGVQPDYNDIVDDMASFDYLKPKFYNITLADGTTMRFHHDYVLRFEGRTAPKLVKMGQLQGWGYSEGSHIINELVRDEKIKSSIQSLMDKSLIEVIKMSGMRGVFLGADADNEQQLKKRLQMVNWGRNFNSLTFLDKDDEYSQNEFGGLSGLADLLSVNMWQVAAALEMEGVLFGELKGGLSQETEALERYDTTINGRCESYLRPIYEKFITILYKLYNIKDEVKFTFNSLLVKQRDKEKIEALKNFTDLCSVMLQDGILTPQLYARALQKYSTDSTIDFGLTDDVINKLDDEVQNAMEDIDLDNEQPQEREPDEQKSNQTKDSFNRLFRKN